MEIYLIRHGECENKGPLNYDAIKQICDPVLTAKGWEQARKLAKSLKNVRFNTIYCSDLSRAMSTAKELAAETSSEVIVTPSFREIHFGHLEMSSWASYPQEYEKWKRHDADVPYPGGENGADVWQRCQLALTPILQSNVERVAIVSHGGTIRSMICGFLQIPQEHRFKFGAPILNCSVNIIQYEDGVFRLHTLNRVE